MMKKIDSAAKTADELLNQKTFVLVTRKPQRVNVCVL